MSTPLSQKRNRTLIALSLVLFVLVTLAQLFTAEKPIDNRKIFTTLSSKQVTKIGVTSQTHPAMEFQKLDNGWHLTKPFKRRADNSRIQVLLAILSLPKLNIYNKQNVDAINLGLEPPIATLTLNDTEFFFGNKENNNDRRYLQTDDKITLAADIVYPLLSQGLFGFVEKSLVPPGFVRLESSNYTLTKTNNLWQSSNGSTEDAEAIVSAWLGQFSEDILDWPLPSPKQLQEAKTHIVKLKMELGNELVLEIFELQDISLIHPIESNYALAITPDQFANLKVSSK